MTITGPVLIYLHEILVDSHTTTHIGDPNRQGALICRSEDSTRVSWHFTDGAFISPAPTSNTTIIKQIRTVEGATPSVSRLSRNRVFFYYNDPTNGLWHCRLNARGESAYDEQINVGIYSRSESLVWIS